MQPVCCILYRNINLLYLLQVVAFNFLSFRKILQIISFLVFHLNIIKKVKIISISKQELQGIKNITFLFITRRKPFYMNCSFRDYINSNFLYDFYLSLHLLDSSMKLLRSFKDFRLLLIYLAHFCFLPSKKMTHSYSHSVRKILRI